MWKWMQRVPALFWAALVLAVGLATTYQVSIVLVRGVESRAQAAFDVEVQRIKTQMTQQLERQLTLQHAGAALFASSDDVTRADFQQFVDALDLPKSYPAITTFGFIRRVPDAELPAFLQARADERVDFKHRYIKPLTDPAGVPEHFVLDYAEPASARRAVGLDLATSPDRMGAMQRAARSGVAVFAPPLPRATDPTQMTMGMYMPTYTTGAVPATPEGREQFLQGFIIALVDVSRFVEAAVNDTPIALDFELIDPVATPEGGGDPGVVLYDRDGHMYASGGALSSTIYEQRLFKAQGNLFLANRFLKFTASSLPAFEATVDRSVAMYELVLGSLVSLMAAYLTYIMFMGRQLAEERAEEMTADLARLALVARNTSNAVVITDVHDRITWVNDAFTRINGHTLSEAVGRVPDDLLNAPDTSPDALADIHAAKRMGQGVKAELLNQAKDGRRYWMRIDLQPLHDPQGQLTGYMSVESDITAEKELTDRMAAALRENAALMATIDHHSLVSQTDLHGTITDVNEALCHVSGYSKEELLGNNHRLLNSGHHPAEFWDEMWATVSSGQAWRREVCNRAKDGSLYWVDTLVAPFMDGEGNVQRYVSIRNDITARKQADQALLRVREQLEMSNAAALIGTWEYDVLRDQLTCSRVTRSIFEVDALFELTRRSALNYFPEGDVREQARALMAKARETGQGWDAELQIRTHAGKLRWVRSISVTEVVDGRCVRMYGTFQNVDERKQRELELELANGRLRLENLIEGTRAGTWEWNLITGDGLVNESWAAMVGQTLAELGPVSLETLQRITHPEDYPRVKATLRAHFSGETDYYEASMRCLHADGHWVWVQDRGRVIARLPDGRVATMAGTRTDISALKAAEAAAAESGRILRSAIDALNQGFALFDPQDCLVLCNTEYLRFRPKTAPHIVPGASFESIIRAAVSHGEIPDAHGREEEWVQQRLVQRQQPQQDRVQRLASGRVLRLIEHTTPDGYRVAFRVDVTEIEQAREAAAEKERILRSAIDALGEAFVLYDPQDRLVFCNERYKELYAAAAPVIEPGRTFEEIIRYGAERGEYPEAVGRVEAWVHERLQQHREANRNLVQKLANGKVLRIVEQQTPDRYRVGFRIDITELEQARAQAQAKEALLTSALEAVGAALSVFDADERLVLANDRFYAIHHQLGDVLKLGIRFEDFLRAGLAADNIDLKPDQQEAWLAQRLRSFRAGTTDNVVRLSDGSALRVVERRTAEGLCVGLRFDESELENARRVAHQALVQQKAVFEVLPVGISLTDPQGNIIDCNPASEHLLGISKADHLARNYAGKEWDIFREDGTPMPAEEYASVRALTTRQPVRNAVMQVQVADQRVVLSVSAMPVEDPSLGVVTGYVDITELMRARQEAVAASLAKSQFVANMSHEIRTPMNAILGMLNLLQGTELTVRQKDYAEKSESAAKSLLGILNDILDFSKVEAGKLELDPEPFAFDKLVRDLAIIYSSNLKSKHLELLFDIDPNIPRVLIGDALRLQQVLINLGGNAIKFTAQGEVLLRVRLVSRGQIDGLDTVSLRFDVHDSGIGIAPEAQAKIFSGFTQAESSTSRKYGGTGLGLAISQRLVRLMGGELALNSVWGEGSTFYFELPLQVPVDVPADFAPHDRSALQGLKVLVVDDNLVSQQIMTGMLQSLGWGAVVAEGADDALSIVDQGLAVGPKPFDVIFLDWDMPGKDGLTLAAELAPRFASGQRPLFIMVTASGRDLLQTAPEAQRDLLDGFLVKPVTSSMLYDAVADATHTATEGAPRSVAVVQGARLLNGMRLLVVEDNLINQQVAEELLSREGALVTLAGDGQQAVDALSQQPQGFDAVLMDMQMPVLDGLQATHAIRNRLHLLDLPIVAMTANAMLSDREACLAAGMNDHVGKPFELQHLVRTLLRWAGNAVRPYDPSANAEGGAGEAAAPGSADAARAANVPSAPESGVANKPIYISDEELKSLKKEALAQPWPEQDRLDVAAALQRLGGDPAFYVRIARNYCNDLPTVAARLAELTGHGTPTEVAALLHTLKGTSSTVGAFLLAQLSADAERDVKAGTAPTGEAVPWLAAIRTEAALTELAMRRVFDEVQRRLSPHAPPSAVGEGAASGAVAQATPVSDWRPQWLARLQALEALLSASDMEALELHDEMLQDANVAHHPDWQTLHAAMEQMDFEQALGAVHAMLSTP